jgi:hypothetical protein
MAASAGMTYAQASGYPRGMSVYSDILCGSWSEQTCRFKPGEEVARRVALFFVEVTSEETLALAQSCRIEEKPAGQMLHFRQPGGKSQEIRLLSAKPAQS